jgi:hypothetical protein
MKELWSLIQYFEQDIISGYALNNFAVNHSQEIASVFRFRSLKHKLKKRVDLLLQPQKFLFIPPLSSFIPPPYLAVLQTCQLVTLNKTVAAMA